jgi:SOS response associated peptidase (SRAP)
MKDGRSFAFAGLWKRWGQGDELLESCTILTTEPNELCAPIHDRMPVILGDRDYEKWLDPSVVKPDEVKYMLDSYPADEMVTGPVSTHVNNVRDNDAECVTPIEAVARCGSQQSFLRPSQSPTTIRLSTMRTLQVGPGPARRSMLSGDFSFAAAVLRDYNAAAATATSSSFDPARLTCPSRVGFLIASHPD